MIVLDTNVVWELMRPAPDGRVLAWVRERVDTELATTAVTLAEIRYGIERVHDGRRKELLRRTADEVFAAFPQQVLSFDVRAALKYATIVSGRDRVGRPIDGFDAQIASICAVHDAALATRNDSEFEQTGVAVVNPWRD